jgi:hypothetical protein
LTLIPKVREWLENQGFPLEMQTAAAFRAAGFVVNQSSFYGDSETGKSREIDVVATHPDDLGIISIRFVIECKGGKKPWVLLCSHDTLRNYNRLLAFAASSKTARHVLVSHLEDFKALEARIPWIEKKGLIGYSLRQAHSEKDTAYEAAAGLTKACNSFTVEDGKSPKRIAFAFPVIVVDGPLIRCSLAENGDLELEEVSDGEFLFGQEFSACIRVVTASYLSTFASQARQVMDSLRIELRSDENQIRESWTSGG